MGIAHKNQKIQDWITQQWVILFGKKINRANHKWLLGPFGGTRGIGMKFIQDLAKEENLVINEQKNGKGLIQSIDQLNLSKRDLNKLSKNVIDFYENTSDYKLELSVKWNPIFKVFGRLLRIIFSKRIEQLNIPIKSLNGAEDLTSEIIQLSDPRTEEVKRTIWLRTFKSTGEVVYSGIYGTCLPPSGTSCIKAIFPLPNGSATVILTPQVGNNGELILASAGKKIGDSGFYFLLSDSKGQLWAKFIKSFEDKLVVSDNRKGLIAIQTLTLWKMRVLEFKYLIRKHSEAI